MQRDKIKRSNNEPKKIPQKMPRKCRKNRHRSITCSLNSAKPNPKQIRSNLKKKSSKNVLRVSSVNQVSLHLSERLHWKRRLMILLRN